ncbi:acyltransferase family protein [Paraflavitalea pollutisoli]|uniref:acyltransferase family protein n=1 Tax=Paraflavitalea pollutisoli TaxID=3034143 RepID=UPI0023ED4761|nr:acyltransferase family protein [Paraflavitalea sp. H1-2-19X]
MKYLSIRFLQAIAVLSILAASGYLYAEITTKANFSTLPPYFNIGLAGFDLLFVIAGFVVSQQFRNYHGGADAARFLGNRFIRINLLFYITSLLCYGLSLLQERIANGGIFFNQDEVIQRIIDTIILVPATDAQFLYNPFLPITWALAFLWLSYLLYSVAILISRKQKILLMAVFIAILNSLQYILQPVDLRLTFLWNPILAEFLLGMILFRILDKLKHPQAGLGYLMIALSLAWLIALCWLSDPAIGHPGNILAGILSIKRLLYWGIPSGVLLMGVLLVEQAGHLKTIWQQGLFQRLGRASYPIFLAIGLMGPVMQLLETAVGSKLPVVVLVLMYVLIAILLGFGIHQLARRFAPKTSQTVKPVAYENSPTLIKTQA